MTFPGTARIQQIMGLPVEVDVRTALPSRELAPLLDDAFAWLGRVEQTFGPVPDGSGPVSSLDGVTTDGITPPTGEAGRSWAGRRAAAGRFDMPLGEGHVTGHVMGWAVERLSRALSIAGAVDHRVGGGGYERVRGSAGPGQRWRIGLRDARTGRVFKVLFAHDLAVATTGGPGSVTVVGPDLEVAATHAAAIATMAPPQARRFASRLGATGPYDVLIVDRERRAVNTPGLAAYTSVTSTRLAG
jgi:thiamine biosynthesis lipoprotein